MKKFLLYIFLFLVPFISLFLITYFFYSPDNTGGLLRVGYLMNINEYRDVFKKDFGEKKYFTKLSEKNINKKDHYNIITIGDSFSEQENYGYQNYLAKNKNIKILHISNNIYLNQFEFINKVVNGNLLDSIKTDYVLLQCVERFALWRHKGFDCNKSIFKDSIKKLIIKRNSLSKNIKYKFFTDRIIKFPLYNLLYLFSDNAFFSGTYKVKTNQNLFSVNNKNLLFSEEDLTFGLTNNDFNKVCDFNNEINKLSEKLNHKGIKLILLVSPDKYDIYFDYIVNKEKYQKPLFFSYINKLQKQYIYINSKEVLSDAIKSKKDIYFYDDTHWSPFASDIIAHEIYNSIK